MKNFIYLFLSSGIIGYLIIGGILLLILLVYYFFGRKKENPTAKQTKVLPNKLAEVETKLTYDPSKDKLNFGVYQQHFNTWWYDNDGDKHDYGNIYANLRFYENGTVIGIRSSTIPEINVLDSFTMKGNWTLEENRLSLNLKKIVEIDDTIKIDISEYEERQMKYYGKIADDKSLIKSGDYHGIISGDTINIGKYLFTRIEI